MKFTGLERYEGALWKAASHLVALNPTSIIALARKGPRLVRMMKVIGISLPGVPIFTDNALDFLDAEDLGKNPVIFDDVVIVGSSLYRLRQKILDMFGVRVKVVAVYQDHENVCQELVPDLLASESQTEANVQGFSSEIIRAITLLGLPYDVDHPIFSLDRDQGCRVFKELCVKAKSVHREHLSLQYADTCEVTVFHFDIPNSPSIIRLRSLIGTPEILKLKVIESRYLDNYRFVAISCFPVLPKDYVRSIWEQLSLSKDITTATAMYRVLCFAGACVFAEAIHPEMTLANIMWDEAWMNMGDLGILAVKSLGSAITSLHQEPTLNGMAYPIVSKEDINAFSHAFGTPKNLIVDIDKHENCLGKICEFWRNVFREVELGFRQVLHKRLREGDPIDEVMSSPCSKRLSSGFTLHEFFQLVGLTDPLECSLALDLAVDSGVQVPMYAEAGDYVARVYHHGESVWDGDRLASLIAATWSELKGTLSELPVIAFEKYMVLLYELSENLKIPAFSRVVHYLSPPRMQRLDPRNIEVDLGWEAHGTVLEVASLRKGVDKKGVPRISTGRPSAYWLLDNSRVLVKGSKGRSLILNDKAIKTYLTKQAVSKEILAPVKMLFRYLATSLPDRILVGSGKKLHEFDQDDMLRFLSSCAQKRQYIHAIAQDALLAAQEFFEKDRNASYWGSRECWILSGEIYKKWLVRTFKDDIWRQLHDYASENEVDDRFDLVIEPLNPSHDAIEYTGESKIEDRCLTLMLCIESLAISRGKQASKEKERAFLYLRQKGHVVPKSDEEKIAVATAVAEEIMDMFPALLSNLEDVLSKREVEYFIFSDMRDSSQPGETEIAELAKEELRNALADISDDSVVFHMNDDLNDEKDVYVVGQKLAEDVIKQLIRKYSARGKYARIGVVTSTDTFELAEMRSGLPSSPSNYCLAKKLAHYLRESTFDDEKKLDVRHGGQKHGIVAVSNQARLMLEGAQFWKSRKQFTSVDEFLVSSGEGWVHVGDKKSPVSGSNGPEIGFSVFVYR